MSSCHTIEACSDAVGRATIRRPLTTVSQAAHAAVGEPLTVLGAGGVNGGLRGAGCILGRDKEEDMEVTSHHSVQSHHHRLSTVTNIVPLTPRAVVSIHTVTT